MMDEDEFDSDYGQLRIAKAQVVGMRLWAQQLADAGGTGTFLSQEIVRRLNEAEFNIRYSNKLIN